MSNNLPPGVSITDSDAPWNQDHPEPDWQCTECDRYGLDGEIVLDSKSQTQPECPECGAEIESF